MAMFNSFNGKLHDNTVSRLNERIAELKKSNEELEYRIGLLQFYQKEDRVLLKNVRQDIFVLGADFRKRQRQENSQVPQL